MQKNDSVKLLMVPKVKLLKYGKFNYLTNISNTLPHMWAKTTF